MTKMKRQVQNFTILTRLSIYPLIYNRAEILIFAKFSENILFQGLNLLSPGLFSVSNRFSFRFAKITLKNPFIN